MTPSPVPRWAQVRIFLGCLVAGAASGVLGFTAGCQPSVAELASLKARELQELVEMFGLMGLGPGAIVGAFALARFKRTGSPRVLSMSLAWTALIAFPLPCYLGHLARAAAGC